MVDLPLIAFTSNQTPSTLFIANPKQTNLEKIMALLVDGFIFAYGIYLTDKNRPSFAMLVLNGLTKTATIFIICFSEAAEENI